MTGFVTQTIHQEVQEVSLSLSASHATAVVMMSRTINAWTPNGVSLGSTSETGAATIDVDFCPDASGVAAGMISFTGHGTVAPGSGAAPSTYQVQTTGGYRIHVNDMAETASVDVDGSLQFSATGGDSPADVAATFSGGYGDTANVGGTITGDIKYQRMNGSAADINTMNNAIYSTVLLASMVAEGAAKDKWRGGACVGVRVSPASMMVDANASFAVTATAFQKFEMADLDAPVVATFSGIQSLDPVNMPKPSPATFNFVAGGTQGNAGTASLKSTSKRGIGTGSATYTVKCDDMMTCPDGFTLNEQTCKCECLAQQACPAGQQWDKTACKCVCATQACPPGEYWDPSSCKCVCGLTCPPPLVLNPDACTCDQVCQLDATGAWPIYCVWTGTVHATIQGSGQWDIPSDPGTTDVATWSVDYDASLEATKTGHLSGPVSGHYDTTEVTTDPYCTSTDTTETSISTQLDLQGALALAPDGAGNLQVVITTLDLLTLAGDLTGTDTASGSGMCPDGYSQPVDAAILGFVGTGTSSGSTFSGTSTMPASGGGVYGAIRAGGLVIDGFNPTVQFSWDLTLVHQ
jgi:hypothetical protein